MSIRSRAAFSAFASLFLLTSAWAQAPNVRKPVPNGPVSGVFAANRYAVFLSDQPVSAQYQTRESMLTTAAANYKARVELAQANVRRELEARGAKVVGSVSTLLNAVFVAATPEQAAALQSVPGVAGVRQMRRGQKSLNKAIPLMNGPAAWVLSAVGGEGTAGKGIKIGILDTGIDQTHPAFVDTNLTDPGGKYPICTTGHSEDCAYTSKGSGLGNKVIVARSYVRQIAASAACVLETLTGCTMPVNSTPNPATSQPDDYSPRDRDGHGTAVASAAAANTTTAAAVSGGAALTITGMAPKAYLGNYKIYGSPGVNDYPPEDVWIQAIDDALNDGMDIVNLSSGVPAISGALDYGPACGLAGVVPCDPLAFAFEAAAQAGMVVVAAAGNSGVSATGLNVYPAYNTIGSPANAPSVIAVGASNNSHGFTPSVSAAVSTASIPSNLKNIAATASDSFVTNSSALQAFQAPLVDVAFVGSDSYACGQLPAGSLAGSFALVQRGGSPTSCTYSTKGTNVQAAGAIGMILYQSPTSGSTWNGSGPNYIEQVQNFNGPVVGISNSDGVALKTYLDITATSAYAANNAADPWPVVTIDLAGSEQTSLATKNTLITFSSLGPALGGFAASCLTCGFIPIKPDIVAVGGSDPYTPPDPNDLYLYNFSGMYMATEKFDPLGGLYSATGFVAADGTSFAAPLAAGAAALVKQAHASSSTLTAMQIRSALVNGANATGVTTDDCALGLLPNYTACTGTTAGNAVDIRGVGAGLLDVGSAAQTNLLSQPATIGYGAVKTGVGSLPSPPTITIYNLNTNPVKLNVAINPAKGGAILTAICTVVGSATCPDTYIGTTITGIVVPQWTNYSGPGQFKLTVTFLNDPTVPPAGIYSGVVSISGIDDITGLTVGTNGVSISTHVPYMFLVGSGVFSSGSSVTGNVMPLGDTTSFDGIAGTDMGPLALLVTDANGIPVPGASVTFSESSSAVTFRSFTGEPACSPASSTAKVTCATDNYGIAYVDVLLGATPQTATISAITGGLSSTQIQYAINIRKQPTTAGVAEAAQGKTTIAPGSYVALYGSGLSDYTALSSLPSLPMSWEGVTVSFDVPSANLSVPGTLLYVSPTQIDVQAPWELQGLPAGTQVSVKATINENEYGNVVTVPISDVAPAFFQSAAGNVAALIANTFTYVTPSAPAGRGQQVQIYANGLGPVNNQPADGVPVTAKTATTKNTATVTIGGISAPVTFSGLASGTPGLYELDVTVPSAAAGLSAGSQPVVLTINGKTATSNIQVK